MMWGWGNGMGWGGWLAMSLMMVAFWGLIVALVVWAVPQFRPTSEHRSGALSVLEERFARGEIDREEFDQRRGVLQGK